MTNGNAFIQFLNLRCFGAFLLCLGAFWSIIKDRRNAVFPMLLDK